LKRSHFGPLTGHEDLAFGTPLLFDFLTSAILPAARSGQALYFDPMAFAGWVGLLVTSLNLMPIGQLDGGHVLYSLLPQKANRIARVLLLAALFMVIWQWKYYGSWALIVALLFFMGPTHPPTADDEEPLGALRIVLGWLTLAFILIGFTPTPISFPFPGK
jgi:membrane-associated protease RseP (regulator of RpoE activity)